jgi:hypothetical protein
MMQYQPLKFVGRDYQRQRNETGFVLSPIVATSSDPRPTQQTVLLPAEIPR